VKKKRGESFRIGAVQKGGERTYAYAEKKTAEKEKKKGNDPNACRQM